MTKSEISILRRAIVHLNMLIKAPRDPIRRRCPVTRFARGCLIYDPGADVSCEQLWDFYEEVAAAGELPPLNKAAFLRLLPTVIQTVFGATKRHDILRAGSQVRGFVGVGISEQADLPAMSAPGPGEPDSQSEPVFSPGRHFATQVALARPKA
jgi:hypothetical protein